MIVPWSDEIAVLEEVTNYGKKEIPLLGMWTYVGGRLWCPKTFILSTMQKL